MQADIKPLKLVTIITDRHNARNITTMLNEHGYHLHVAYLGRGTAPTEMSSILGLGETEKAIIVLMVSEEKLKNLFSLLHNEVDIGGSGGIAFTTPLNSVCNMEVVKFILGIN